MRHCQQSIYLFALLVLAFTLGCGSQPVAEKETPAPENTAVTEQTKPAATSNNDKQDESKKPDAADTNLLKVTKTSITGTLMGTKVNMKGAELDSQFAVFEGDGWGFSPSILFFLFLDNDEQPDGKTIKITPETKGFDANIPHLHMRYHDPKTDKIETVVAVNGFDLTLRFGQRKDGKLPGSLELTIPADAKQAGGEAYPGPTKLGGTFLAEIDE